VELVVAAAVVLVGLGLVGGLELAGTIDEMVRRGMAGIGLVGLVALGMVALERVALGLVGLFLGRILVGSQKAGCMLEVLG